MITIVGPDRPVRDDGTLGTHGTLPIQERVCAEGFAGSVVALFRCLICKRARCGNRVLPGARGGEGGGTEGVEGDDKIWPDVALEYLPPTPAPDPLDAYITDINMGAETAWMGPGRGGWAMGRWNWWGLRW